MSADVVTFKASPVLLARLDELAASKGGNRSAAIKAAILEASIPADAPSVPDEHEVLALLSEAARGGNVPAMKELRAYHRERVQIPGHGDAVDELDELARRRQGGGDGPAQARQARPARAAARTLRNAETPGFTDGGR